MTDMNSTSNCPLTTDPQLRAEAREATARIEVSFPKGLAQPALRALAAAGYTRLDQLAAAREEDLMALHGMGPKAMTILKSALLARGLAFRP